MCATIDEWTNLSSDFNVAKRRREISTEYNSATATTTTNGASAMSSGGGIAYWEKRTSIPVGFGRKERQLECGAGDFFF